MAGSFEWPHDSNGDPMVLVSASASEKWPHVQFGNLEIGPVSVTKFTTAGMEKSAIEDALSLCEEIVGTERERIRAELKK